MLRGGHVLVHRLADDAFWHRLADDAFWALPGGRVELGETASGALAREIREEPGVAARSGLVVVESFFRMGGRPSHEIGHSVALGLPDAFSFAPDGAIRHRAEDTGGPRAFRSLPATEAALTACGLRPAPLRARLAAPPAGTEHLVAVELAADG